MSNTNFKDIKLRFPKTFTIREQNVHKGIFGSVGVIGGAKSMQGAVVLAGMSALKLGCGKCFVSFISNIEFSYIYFMPELMVCGVEDIIKKSLNSIVVGCGLGTDDYSLKVLNKILSIDNLNLVLDADALNIISKNPDIILLNNSQKILTPHVLEASRLLECSVKDIESNRIDKAILISKKFNCWTVLKGFNSIIANVQGEYWINESGNNSLSTSGTGDILAGALGSLLAQKIPIEEAVKSAVWLHGAAADYLVEIRKGPIGLIASEFIDAMRFIRNGITYDLL